MANFCPRTLPRSGNRIVYHGVQVANYESNDLCPFDLDEDTIDCVVSSTPVRIRPPYVVTGNWNAFADMCLMASEIGDWNEYVMSASYLLDIAKIGRPMWGAAIEALKLSHMIPAKEIEYQTVISRALEHLEALGLEKFPVLKIEIS